MNKYFFTLFLFLSVLLPFTADAYGQIKGTSLGEFSNCDYYLIEVSYGDYTLAEWYGGSTPYSGDTVVGELHSYGFKDLYNISRDNSTRVWIDDWLLSEDSAAKKLIDKCGYDRSISTYFDTSYGGYPTTYSAPVTTPTCPANATYISGQCTCNSGYSANGSTCISYTKSCQATNNNDANIIGTKDSTGKINCSCASGYTWNGASCISYSQTLPSAQSTNIDTGPQMTQDERCVKLSLGTFYNTDKQSCDTCLSGTIRITGTNTCQKPVPVVKKAPKEDQVVSVAKSPDVKKVVSNKISTTSQATSSPATTTSYAKKSSTFWQKVVSPFKNLWGMMFK